ncbi:MAG: AraC family ligand binding domain-containing protein [Vicinamibacterales bacterium]
MKIAVLFLLSAAALLAQTSQLGGPPCQTCAATYISTDEFKAYVDRAIANRLIDQQVRAVDVGATNLGIGIVYRGTQASEANIAEHGLIGELYYILEGSATLVLGADLVGLERRPATSKTVRVQNGPGNNAASMRDPVSYRLTAGDVAFIPAGTGHQFAAVDQPITYLMVRFDPDKIVPLKSAAESAADLKTTGVETPEEQKREAVKFAHLGKDYEPSCRLCPGTHVAWSEVLAYEWRARATGDVNQQIRAVDFGKLNVGAGISRRGRVTEPGTVVAHDRVSQVLHVIDGSATLEVGSDLIGARPQGPDASADRLLNGPGRTADSIGGSASYQLNKGDVVVIPAGTGYRFVRIDDHVTYLAVRVDPDKVTPLKSQAESQLVLATR